MKYKIILTGGYANFFKQIIKKKTIVDQNITIRGISKIYEELITYEKKQKIIPLLVDSQDQSKLETIFEI